MNAFSEDDFCDLYNPEKQILKLIHQNDSKALRDMKLHLRDLNFLEEFPEVEIDTMVTPLIVASHLGRVDILRILMENESIDINKCSQELQQTPLCVACAAGNYEIVEILISNGADVNKPDVFGRPPFYFCFTRLQEETNVFENNLICMKMARALLQNGADINFIVNKDKGRTMLMEHCRVTEEMSQKEKNDNLKVIKFLIENGADTMKKCVKGKTAYDYASKHPYKNEVQNLLRKTHQIYFYGKSKGSALIDQNKIKKFKFFSAEGSSKATCCNIFGCCN